MRINHVILLLQATTALYAVSTDGATAVQRPRVDGGVHRTLRRQATVNLMVTMKDDTAQVLESVHQKEASFASRGEMISHMVSQLERHATASQQEITTLLAQESTTGNALASEVRSFWISNQLFFRDATFALVEKLSAMSGVASIEEEMVFPLPVTTKVNASSSESFIAGANEWGITKIQAPDVWAKGNTGQGVVVGSIDTGVRSTHESLRGNFRKEFGWFDPETKAAEPYDADGHGTHTLGTIVGANGIGVAPGATWITCKGCQVDGCAISDLLACFQFMTCPTDPLGTTKDCSKAPRLVSNSWGGGRGNTNYDSAIMAWRKAQIIPVFSNGNSGPECRTANSPADNANVIAVGATDETDGLADFSSKGPTVRGRMKPEISAPGASVRSAWPTNDGAFELLSGTSMAAPHVSGVVALLLSAQPTLTYDQVRQRLVETTDQSFLKPADIQCGSKNGVFPNNMYGHGRLNALSVVNGKRAPQPPPPTPAPTTPTPTTPAPEPTPAPTPPAGVCGGALDAENCERVFFCSWNARGQSCQRWWN